MPFAPTWIDLEKITQREISQTEKDKHHIFFCIPLICRNQINIQMNLNIFTKQKQTYLWLPKGKSWEEG